MNEPIYTQPTLVSKTPLVLPLNMPKDELDGRLAKMRDHLRWALQACPMHALRESTLKTWLVRSGLKHELSTRVFS